MPIVEIRVIEGRPDEQLEQCLRQVARTVSETLHAPLSSVRVVLHELPASRWAVGDQLKSEEQP